MAKPDELLASVKDILLKEWDPIGVNHHEECKDEYDSYAPTICRLLKEGAGEAKIAAYLGKMRTVAMFMPANEQDDLQVAQDLVALVGADRREW